MFIWPWGIGDADEDLEELKGPTLALQDAAELVAQVCTLETDLPLRRERDPALPLHNRVTVHVIDLTYCTC